MALLIASSLSRPSPFRFIPKTTKFTSPSILTFLTTINPKYPTRSRFVSSSSAMASESKESPSNNPGLHTTPDEATKSYFMQQTMFRIKDPKVSLDFYSRVLGMSNWGTESDPDFKGYHNGNSEPCGFGHIGVNVDDTYKACGRFEHLGVEFVKKPDDDKRSGLLVDKSYMMIVKAGWKMKGIAFIKDPDDYWIEIFDLKTIGSMTSGAA
ncbi:unnamed protein product [Camellia sinensis]